MAKKQRHGQKAKQQKASGAKAFSKPNAATSSTSPAKPTAGADARLATSTRSPPNSAVDAKGTSAAVTTDAGVLSSSSKGSEKAAVNIKGTAAGVATEEPAGEQFGRVVGLQNLGNTCFFNSVAQVLSASMPVWERFLLPGKRGSMGQGLHEVVQAAYGDAEGGSSPEKVKGKKAGRGPRPGIHTPQRLHSAVLQVAPQFKGGQEQDSHELLRLLLDGLHTEEAKAARARARGQARAAQENGDVEQAQAPQTFVQDAFGFQLASRIECDHCHYASATVEDFMDLSIEVPVRESGAAEMPEDSSHKGKKGKGKKKGGTALKDEQGDAEPAPGPAMTAKQRKKQLKLAKKAMELDRKRQRRSRASSPEPEDPPQEPSPVPTVPAESSNTVKSTTAAAIEPEIPPEQSPCAPEAETGGDSADAPGTNSFVSCTTDTAAGPAEGWATHSRDSRGANSRYQTAEGQTEGTSDEGYSGVAHHSPDNAASVPQGEDSLAQIDKLAEATSSSQEHGLFKKVAGQPDRLPKPVRLKVVQNALGSSVYHQDDIDTLYSSAEQPGSDVAEQPGGDDGQIGDAVGDVEEAEEGESMSGLGSLFDEAAEATDLFATVAEPSLPSGKEIAADLSLESCLAAFFSSEVVSWECPAESRTRKGAMPSDSNGFSTPEPASRRSSMRRTVSFSGEKPAVRLIPGSVEQRGTDFRQALRGQTPFCRPLKLDDAYLLITAESDALSRKAIHVTIHPQDQTDDTLAVLQESVALMTVSISEIEDSDDEGEQEEVMQQAQLLMDCVADLVTHEGVEGMQAMVKGGVELVPGTGGLPWKARGSLPENLAQGTWEYPSTTPCSAEDTSPASFSKSYLAASPPSQVPSSPQTPSEPCTPAAASTTSFESIDLGDSRNDAQSGSPVKRPASLAPIRMERGDSETLSSSSPTALSGILILGSQGASEMSPAVKQASPLANLHSSNTAYHDAVPGSAVEGDDQPGGGETSSGSFHGAESQAAPGSVAEEKRETASEDFRSPTSQSTLAQGGGPVTQRGESGSTSQGFHDAQSTSAMADSSSAQTGSEKADSQGQSPAAEDARAEAGTADFCVKSLETEEAEAGSANVAASGRSGGDGSGPARRKPAKGGLKNVMRTAHKGYRIHRAPQLLTVHLKRFQIDFRGRAQKILGHVPFGFNLDIAPFCDPKGPDASGAQYSLVGVVVHQGSSMKTGHYFAYVHRAIGPSANSAPLNPPRARTPSSAADSQPGNLAAPDGVDQLSAQQPGEDRASGKKQPGKDGGCVKEQPIEGGDESSAASSSPEALNGRPEEETRSENGQRAEGGSTGFDDESAKLVESAEAGGEESRGPERSANSAEMALGAAAVSGRSSLANGIVHTTEEPLGAQQSESQLPHPSVRTATKASEEAQPSAGQAHGVSAPERHASENGTKSPEQGGEGNGDSGLGSGLSSGQKAWYFAGDEKVRKVMPEEVLGCEAYILLYQRVG